MLLDLSHQASVPAWLLGYFQSATSALTTLSLSHQ